MEPPRVTQAVGGGVSADSVEIPRPLCQDSPARDSIPTEWTDEKHSLYLKSMEASFVNELYSSFDLLGWRSQREHSSDPKLSGKKHASSCTSSCQFKVLQSGCWGNINFARHESQLEMVEGTGVILANPWIRHFRSSQRKQLVISSTLQGKSTFGSLAVSVSGKMALTSAGLASNLEQLPASHSNLRHYDDPVDSSNTATPTPNQTTSLSLSLSLSGSKNPAPLSHSLNRREITAERAQPARVSEGQAGGMHLCRPWIVKNRGRRRSSPDSGMFYQIPASSSHF